MVVAAVAFSGCKDSGTPSGSESATPASSSPAASPPNGIATGEPAPPQATASPPIAPAGVTLQRIGGFAGKLDTLVVATDGRWTFTPRDGAKRSGQLTGSQLSELRQLVTNPHLVSELRQKPSGPPCNDAFSYRLRVGDLNLTQAECGGGTAPTFDAIVKLLAGATPM